jgi:multisubunit Na+/H+ antiporter MnhF subunit
MFVCVLFAFILCLPRVEAGNNTSTVVVRGDGMGTELVSGETVSADLRE